MKFKKREVVEVAKVLKTFKINEKEEIFCREYIIDLNATQAAIRAGYSARTARTKGSQLLTKVNVSARVEELKAERNIRTQVTAEWVIRELVEVVRNCKEGQPVYDQTGKRVYITNEDSEIAAAYTFNAKGATGALDLLGKHLGLYTEKIEISGEVKLSETLKKARERIKNGGKK